MAKSSIKQIKEDEKKILAELQKNSRGSADSIAEKCGFSRQKVWRLMNRLEENKTIWGYGTVVDNEKLELTEYFILVKKTNIPVEEAADIIISRKLEKKADELGIKIESSSYLHGQYDWTLSFTAENIRQAKKFSEALNEIYHRYISDLILIEKIFPIKKCGIQNPNLKKLKEFV